ncbi:MAG: phosphotransferase family protein, partial [Pseudomonadales bacterium]|nr:phosphotransferase family protein [Pseudomonadales bacterium]
VPSLDDSAARELAYWEKVIDDDEIHPQPVARAAIRWLKANMPPPAQKLAVVHGDFRSGNFLYDGQGDIKGILDWEMCHLGDPLEDLAWSLDPLWNWGQPDLAGRLLPVDDAIAIWEEASGLKVDRQVFQWWRIFASIKGLAIWVSSSEDFHNGESKETILAMAGWVMGDRENQILLDYLSPHSTNEFRGRLS